ncbi:MAG: AAA family ATPase [Thermoleophilia bacterium]|nr:AAA family ATPase [Thermoleophilia bacterium]
MHILGWHVEGFGIFRDFAVGNLPPGIVVFEGPNEAGKSTLLAFLRAVLFGFRARGKGSLYEPLRGGSHGGRVFLATRQGQVIVERFYRKPVRIQMDDGTLLSEPEFQQLLAGLDYQTFSSVFAFSLDELSSFESIGSEQIAARIFAAGLSGAGPSVQDVLLRFEKVQEQLLRPRSHEGEINRLLQEINAVKEELGKARVAALGYPQLAEENESLAKEIEELTSQELKVKCALEEARLLCAAWEIQVDLQRRKQELNELPPVDEFIPQARERLADVKRGLRELEQRRAQQAARVDEKEQEVANLKAQINPRLLASGFEIKRLVGGLHLYGQQEQERTKLQTAWEERGRATRRFMDQLGLGADEEQLKRIDTSLPAKEDLRRFRESFARLKLKLIELETQYKAAQERVASLREEIATQELAEEREAAVLRQEAEKASELVGRASVLLQKLARVEADLEGLKTLKERHTRVAQGAAQRRRRMVYAAGAVLAAVVLGLVITLTVGGLPSPEHNYTLAVGVLVAVFLVAFIALGLRGVFGEQGVLGSFGSLLDLDEERRLEDERRELSDELSKIASVAEAGIQVADDDWPSSLLSALQQRLIEAERQVTRAEEREETAKQLQEDLQAAVRQEAEARRALDEAQQELAELERTFTGWLAERGIPTSLSPDGALDYLSLAEEAQKTLQEWEDLAEQIQVTQERLECWERQAYDTLLKAGLELETSDAGQREGAQVGIAGQELAGAVMAAKVKLEEAEELQRKLDSAEEALRELRGDLIQTTKALRETEQELQELFTQAGAADEAEFVQRLEVYERRQKLKEQIHELEMQLTKKLGADDRARVLWAELEQGRVETWTHTIQTLEHELEQIAKRRETLHVRSGELKEQLRGLEVSANIPELENKLCQLEATLGQSIERWYVAGLAVALLRSTLTRYTEDRQPRVLAEAGRLFAQVTEGRYARVMALPDKSELVVTDSYGRQKSPGQLSRGTAEQLYLCLRMGLAHEFSRHAEPLPVVMDDVLVNFDPRRRRAMAKLLLDFARSHQVLLFTCHPEITEVFLELEPSLRVERMDYDYTSSSV